MPNKKSRRFRNPRTPQWAYGSVCALTLLAAQKSAASFYSDYSGFLEPFLNGGYGSASTDSSTLSGGVTTSTTTTVTNSLGLGAGLRFGAENDGLFSALESSLSYLNSNNTSGELVSFGVTAGGNFTYIPLRAFIGFDPFLFSLTSTMTAPSFAVRLGVSYFLSSKMTLGAVLTHTETTSSDSTTSISGRSNTLGFLLSMPFNIEQPKEPWKSRYQKREQGEREGSDSSAASPALSGPPSTNEPPAPPPGDAAPAPSANDVIPSGGDTIPSTPGSATPPPTGDAASPPPATPDASLPAPPPDTAAPPTAPTAPAPAAPVTAPPASPSGTGIQDPGASAPALEPLEVPTADSPSAPTPPTSDAPPPPPQEKAIEMLPTP